MSKYCPLCDDVKDSQINGPDDLKQHLEQEHPDEIIEFGEANRLEDQSDEKDDDIINVEPVEE